ncbi:MAG: RND transporter [Gallionellales bacterium RIFCSPLOWO2_12_FULL_59_22]|nr:MAG: RND transporter [Gallionellales bacterium RIFCSPLOWO2_02_FULL_59_110]OGT13111.1 MAG: RND transporter [Gallionellales bacterium RIFCSPLOWO2_12_FULL_59_22]
MQKSPSIPLLQRGKRFVLSRKLFGSIALVTALSGCSLTPDYQRPAAPVPAAWPDSVKLKIDREIVLADWPDHFTDPRLQALIGAALENNRDLRIATARIAEARAQYGVQQAERLPNVNATAGRSASLTPAGASSFSANAVHTQRYDVGISLVSFELDFWGRVASLSEAARAVYLASEAAQRAFRLSLIADVANAYLTLLELGERAQLAAETVGARDEYRELTSRRRDIGVSSELDFLQADGAYQAALAERASLERQQAGAANLLDLLVGQPVAQMKGLPDARNLAAQDIELGTSAGLPAEVLLQRPDVLAAEQRLIAANANIGAVRAAFLPRITLTGSVGTASRTLSGLFEAGSDAWSFQPAISMPLFDTGRFSSSVDVAEARKIIAVAEYEKTIQQAFREVADLLNAREKLAEQLAAQQANADAQGRRLKLVEARYKAGIASHLEVLDAQRESFAAQQGALQVRRSLLSAAAQLYKALAGYGSQGVRHVASQ